MWEKLGWGGGGGGRGRGCALPPSGEDPRECDADQNNWPLQ